MWCKSLRIEKYISFRMKWFFWPPFLSVSPFLLLNLARRQSYAYAIGLYTRPEIKSWPDVKFCAHAQCVLPRCSCPQTPWSFPSLPSSSLLSTIFCSRPKFLDELARKRLLRRLKFRTSKFRPRIAFTISTNKLHLPKNGREGLKLGCFTFTRTTRVEIFCTNIKL